MLAHIIHNVAVVKMNLALADLKDHHPPLRFQVSIAQTAETLNYTIKTPHFSLMKQREVESTETPKIKTLISALCQKQDVRSKVQKLSSPQLFEE